MKQVKRLYLSGLALSSILLLAGCVQQKNGVPTGEGWVYKLLVEPMGHLIKFFAVQQKLGFGLAIIIVTLLVRTLILPLGIYQSYKATYQSEKMRYLKPILEPLQERMRQASTQEEQLAAQQEYMAAHKELGVSLFGGMGCLPILIQMPFFTALFYAAKFTDGINTAHFFGINLGSRSLILVVAAGLLYLCQSLLMTVGVDEEQKKQLKSMLLINPIMIVLFSISSPAGVTLYWVVGGLFGIIQQILTTFLIKPKIRARIDEEFDKNPPKLPKLQKAKDVTPTPPVSTPKTEKRNAGKQRSR